MDLQNPYLPADAQDIDNIPLTDPGEIMAVKNFELRLKGSKNYGKRKNK